MILTHRCTACGHPDYFHDRDNWCSHGNCRRHPPELNPEPELIPSFVMRDGVVVLDEELKMPGQRWLPGVRLCGCERCQEIFADRAVAA